MRYQPWVVAFGALAVSACGGEETHQAPAAAVPKATERLTVATAQVAQLKPLAAEVATRDQAEAMPRIAGTLVDLTVREGDQVTKGQVIGRVEDSRIGFETSAYAAQIAAADAQVARVRADLSRVEYLYKRGFYAKAKLDQAVAEARAAEAQAKAARAQRSASAENAVQGAILAPATGRVLRADVPKGSVVQPGMSVATVTAGPVLLRIDVPQSVARRLEPGTTVTLRGSPAVDGRTGRIVQLYPQVSGGRVRADAEVPGLRPELVGERVTAMVDIGARPGIVVPKRFVTNRFGIDYVTVAGKDGAQTSVPVQTAPTGDPERIEILSGVAAGDVILAGGAAQ